MLLVGHFSSKPLGFCPSEFPVLENLRRVILEPRSRSRLSSGPFISICYNPAKQKFPYFSPGTGCLFLPVILYRTELLPPAGEPRPLRPMFWGNCTVPSQQSSAPYIKFTMFVFLVTRCIKLSAEGANNIYLDAAQRASESDTKMQSDFNNIGSLVLAPKIRSGSPSLLEIDSAWWESWHDLTLQRSQCYNGNHDDDMVAAVICPRPDSRFHHTSVNLWMKQFGIWGDMRRLWVLNSETIVKSNFFFSEPQYHIKGHFLI